MKGQPPGLVRASAAGLALGLLGACLGSGLFAMVFLVISYAIVGTTAPPGAGPFDSLTQFALSSLVVALFGMALAVVPGLLGGIAIALLLRRYQAQARLTRRRAVLTGLGIGALMGLLLIGLLVRNQVQSAGLAALEGLGPALLLAGLLTTTMAMAVVVALLLQRAWGRPA